MEQTHLSKKPSAAKDVFSYLLMIIMLYMGVVSFVGLLWQYIEIKFPDSLNYTFGGASSGIRGAISVLLIVWPMMILMSWLIGKDLHAFPEKKDSWIRKWLLYLTLFLSAMTIVIDLITLTNSFLSGEITARFILKVVVVLVVALSVFTYYFWELRKDVTVKSVISRYVALLSMVSVIASIVGGFFLVGSPMTQRLLRMDEQRVSDLQTIQSQILNQWTSKGKIPDQLIALNDPLYGFTVPLDPFTKQPYEYQKMGDHRFSLCATFSKDSLSNIDNARSVPMMYPQPNGMDYWVHKNGRVCFERTIDPELFKPSSQAVPTKTEPAPVIVK